MVAFGCATCIDDDLMSYGAAKCGCWYGFEWDSNCVGWCKIEFEFIVVIHGADATAVSRPSIGDVVLI